jgi:hypothetical protein
VKVLSVCRRAGVVGQLRAGCLRRRVVWEARGEVVLGAIIPAALNALAQTVRQAAPRLADAAGLVGIGLIRLA